MMLLLCVILMGNYEPIKGFPANNSSTTASDNLTVDSGTGSDWLTDFIPVSAISLIVLGLGLVGGIFLARFCEKIHARLAVQDDNDSDMSSETRFILKMQLKSNLPREKLKNRSMGMRRNSCSAPAKLAEVALENETSKQRKKVSVVKEMCEECTSIEASVKLTSDQLAKRALKRRRSAAKSAAVRGSRRPYSTSMTMKQRPLTSVSRAYNERVRARSSMGRPGTVRRTRDKPVRPKTALVSSPLKNKPPMRLLVRADSTIVGMPYAVPQVPKDLQRPTRPKTAQPRTTTKSSCD
ncbi:hypothetical protein CAPTEDRAFT_208402 [Capitella teleta]|uniref:Uncharacterized protein n=1 Tax=Capitella teleta TaxID=283909 RepID=R7TCS9_CAPTE|nr:hypothetical protein CAPTEDRAFT_208402 [Capitella teleta]|eukprot:ELT88881.1 hypothetical protein CAPTEDRAFT_208402 [Capitella teleta]